VIALPAALTGAGQALALPLTVLLPLLAGALVLLLRRSPDLRDGSSMLMGLVLALVVGALWSAPDAELSFTIWNWLPGLAFEFRMEPLGLLFATVSAVLWPLTTLYAVGYMRGNAEKHQTRFFLCFALAIAAAQWIAFSGNLVTLFVGYEFMTLATWPLVAHKGNEDAKRGARVYLAVLLTTSIGLLLPAIVWTYLLTGTTQFSDGGVLAGHGSPALFAVLYAMFLFGIGKAALMPFHRWLPAAMVAPTPVSALLHAVAVVKAGVFSVLKVTIYIFGLDNLSTSGASQPMMWVAAFTLLAAGVIAVRQDNLKKRLAYSTVSQLSYIVLGAALAQHYAVLEGALHIATHAVGKITLFFCAGAIYTAHHLTRVSELDGLGQKMPYTFAAFTVASISIIGLPPLAGSWDKLLLIEGSLEAGVPVMLGVLLAGALLAIAYLMPVPMRAFFVRSDTHGADPDNPSGNPRPRTEPVQEAPLACVLPLCITALACIAMFFFEDALIEPLARRLGSP